MIDLNKVKLVLFDFDDTLCFAADHGREMEGYGEAMVKGDITYWGETYCQPNEGIYRFMCKCRDMGIRMGLISAVDYVCTAINKINWVQAMYCFQLENWCVGERSQKVKMIQSLLNANGYKPEEILFVDDIFYALEEAYDLKVQVASPCEVINFANLFCRDIGKDRYNSWIAHLNRYLMEIDYTRACKESEEVKSGLHDFYGSEWYKHRYGDDSSVSPIARLVLDGRFGKVKPTGLTKTYADYFNSECREARRGRCNVKVQVSVGDVIDSVMSAEENKEKSEDLGTAKDSVNAEPNGKVGEDEEDLCRTCPERDTCPSRTGYLFND